ncbi:hypothetical protein GCM10020295_18780 [Streptomyces cinereospinus]
MYWELASAHSAMCDCRCGTVMPLFSPLPTPKESRSFHPPFPAYGWYLAASSNRLETFVQLVSGKL